MKSKYPTMTHRVIAAIVLLAATVASQQPGQHQVRQPATEQKPARARELVERARAAIGGARALGAIRTLSTSGKVRRFVKYVSVQSPSKVVEKQKTLDGRLDLDFELPGKFRQRVKAETLRGLGYSYAEVVSGDEAWRDPPLRPISSNRDNRVIDVSDVQRTELMVAQGARQQLTFYVFGWLLQSLPSFPLELKYGGILDSAEGRAEAVVADGKGGFRFVMLFDSRTCLPRLIAIPFLESRPPIVLVETAGFFDRRFMMETFARARRERQERAKPPSPHELQLRFSDHRAVGGALIPHRVTLTINGEVFEETVFDGIRINHTINPKKFAPPKRKE